MNSILAFESSTSYGGVALSLNGKITERASQRVRSHAEVLNLYSAELLAEASIAFSEIDAFAVGIGPGSFTGIRVSLNSAKTFAYAFEKPIIEINSLENLAYSSIPIAAVKSLPIVSMINAYKNMVYIALYEVRGGLLFCIEQPQVLRVQDLKMFMKNPALAVGDGYVVFEKYFDDALKSKLVRTLNPMDYPQPKVTAELAGYYLSIENSSNLRKWSEIVPLYLRASEAEETKKGIKYEPI